jgi:cyclopropane fatty-acyl-phospholipid synthase-like methyltransferase
MRYDENYYERGLELGVSGYTNYHWMPEMTIPMVHHIIKHLNIDDTSLVLDFGCAKGYVVKALRLLGYNAFGCDISEYALSQADVSTRGRLYRLRDQSDIMSLGKNAFSHVIAKDVFEHIPYDVINDYIECLRFVLQDGGKLYFLVPLATNGKYIVPFYENDVTHVIREDKEWWINLFIRNGFDVSLCTNKLSGIKENWSMYADGNLQCIVKKVETT